MHSTECQLLKKTEFVYGIAKQHMALNGRVVCVFSDNTESIIFYQRAFQTFLQMNTTVDDPANQIHLKDLEKTKEDNETINKRSLHCLNKVS